MNTKRIALNVAMAAILAPTVALCAVSVSPIANKVIDQVQNDVVTYVVGTVITVFFGFLGFVTRKIGIKVTEYFNRDAMTTSAKNFANSVVDQLQERFLSSDTPDLTDLINRGVTHVVTGSKDAVKESKIETARLRALVEGVLKIKGQDAAAKLIASATMVRP